MLNEPGFSELELRFASRQRILQELSIRDTLAWGSRWLSLLGFTASLLSDILPENGFLRRLFQLWNTTNAGL